MRYAAITMVYNEAVNLPLWIDYYGRQLGRENLFVLDHSSNDGSTESLGEINKIKLPRGMFDDIQRSKMISSFHKALLQFYDIVFYTDSDEFLIPDPNAYSGLKEYLQRLSYPYCTPIGLNVWHLIEQERDIMWEQPLLKQRSYCHFLSAMCKTLISKTPIHWGAGFHESSLFPKFDPDLYLFHIKHIDLKSHLAKQHTTRNLQWVSETMGAHQRWSDEQVRQEYLGIIKRPRLEDPAFKFQNEIIRYRDSTVFRHNAYHCPPFNAKDLIAIPERFKNCL